MTGAGVACRNPPARPPRRSMVTERQLAARGAGASEPALATEPATAPEAAVAAEPTTSAPQLSARTGWAMVGLVFIILSTLNGLTFYSMSAYLDALVNERGFD